MDRAKASIDKKRILLLRTDKIGDVILTTPALSLLRQHYPTAHIAFLANPYTVDVLRDNPYIDEIIECADFWAQTKTLKEKHFDIAILFFVDFKTALTTFLAKIPLRIGPASKIWSLFLTKRICQKRSKSVKHEADYNTDLLSALKIEHKTEKPLIKTTPDQIDKAKKYLFEKLKINKEDKLVIIHPGSGGSAKNWPIESFAKLAEKIRSLSPQISILVSGKPKEIIDFKKFLKNDNKTYFIEDEISLHHLIGLISQGSLFVSNSTGPLHIAVALEVPTVSFFPPVRVMSFTRWGPYANGHIALTPKRENCPECKREKCPNFDCMHQVSVDTAFMAVKKQLGLD
jgi:lipopolysaccharide heptosyltransferase II